MLLTTVSIIIYSNIILSQLICLKILLMWKAVRVLWQHRAVMEPVTRRLWLIGGVDRRHRRQIADILKMPWFSPAKLKLQCINQGAMSINIDDQRIAGTTLRDEIIAFRRGRRAKLHSCYCVQEQLVEADIN